MMQKSSRLFAQLEHTGETLFAVSGVTPTLNYSELKRRDIRALIFYLLYIADSTEYTMSASEIAMGLERALGVIIPPHSEVVATGQSIIFIRDQLDSLYAHLLENWEMERIGLCTKLIIRFGIWELKHSRTDPRIIINEAVELAKLFAEEDAYKLVNGLLDRLAKEQLKIPHK